MSSSDRSFTDFELEGWSNSNVCDNYDQHFGRVTIQSVEALLDSASVKQGSFVLDVCTGAGYAAGEACERGAEAIGVDFSDSQIALSKQHYPKAKFQVGDALALPFEDNKFDAVVNGIGMPHFEDPDSAIREAYRVLKPGGRFSFTVYATPDKAIGFGALYSAVQEHGSMDIGLPVGPNFFLFSDPIEAGKRLKDAGFTDVNSSTIPQFWRIKNADELFDAVETGSVRAAATLNGQTEDSMLKIKGQVSKTIQNYRQGNHYEIPMPAVLISARKP